MRLENFEVRSSIELQTGNLFWDLHNFADFLGLELIPAENTAVMRWSVPSESNPWGCYENKFSGMTLRFKNLQLLHLGAVTKGMRQAVMSQNTSQTNRKRRRRRKADR
jgi:hypothetical protein